MSLSASGDSMAAPLRNGTVKLLVEDVGIGVKNRGGRWTEM